MTQQHHSPLLKGKDLIGLKVLTLENGKLIKNVDELLFDPASNQVKAVLVDPKGWFSDAEIVMFEDIKSIGKDSIVVESERMIKKASDVQEKVSRIIQDDNHLTENKVMTENGTDLGKISDIYFDRTTGQVTELEVSQGAIQNVQSGKKRVRVMDVVKVGDDAIIVKDFVEETLEQQGQHQGVQGAVSTAQQQAPGALEQAKQKLSQLGEKVKEGAQELTKQTQEKAQEMRQDPQTQQTMSTLQSKTEETKNNLEQKANQLKDNLQQGRQAIDDQRKKDALGKYLTVNILSATDETLAKRGDMVTNNLLQQAEQQGLLDKVLGSTSKEPVST